MGEAKRRKLHAAANGVHGHQAVFQSFGIDTSSPGFYDHSAFQARERIDAGFLETYARYVRERSYSTEYVARERRVIPAIAEKLQAEMDAADRRRACMEGALALSKMLEAAGIWNSVMRGAFSAELDGQEGSQRYFHAFGPLDAGASVHGHTWVLAPPFDVVDVAAKLQPWDVVGLASGMPAVVLAEGRGGVVPTEELLIDHDAMIAAAIRGRPMTIGGNVPVEARRFMRDFPGTKENVGGVTLIYQPTATTAPDCPFEDIGSGPGGLRAHALWTEKTRPAVEQILVSCAPHLIRHYALLYRTM